MAGTVTVTDDRVTPIRRVNFDWLSDASGDATASMTYPVNGKLIRAVFVPDGGGTAPSDQYDVAITDGSSIDILAGQAGNLSNVNTIVLVDNFLPVAGNVLNLAVSNGGNAKGGNVYLWFEV